MVSGHGRNFKCLEKNTGGKNSKSIRMVFSYSERRKKESPVARGARDF